MILVGSGALLWRAVRHAVDVGAVVDVVCTPFGSMPPRGLESVPHLPVADVNGHAEVLIGACTDQVIWSVNNPTILGPELVNSGLRIYNVHNGPLPDYRGLPQLAVVHAILDGRTEYAATLHAVDTGIDTGPVLDTEPFAIDAHDRFEDVMLRGLRACHDLFVRNLEAAVDDRLTPVPGCGGARPGSYFGARSLPGLAGRADHPNFERATALGVFAPHYPEISALVRPPRPYRPTDPEEPR
ncbi:formyltransferase family protein [Rhodococcus sp. NPDC127528]|uniref:formyltransferase family protein n=1 Tax=unclassified Rhodococcus (in: high G+C Gram-positive bacteria) TaxID=192944 RepID=UPI003644000A